MATVYRESMRSFAWRVRMFAQGDMLGTQARSEVSRALGLHFETILQLYAEWERYWNRGFKAASKTEQRDAFRVCRRLGLALHFEGMERARARDEQPATS